MTFQHLIHHLDRLALDVPACTVIAEPSLDYGERMPGLHAVERDVVVPGVRGQQFFRPLQSLSIRSASVGQFSRGPKSATLGEQRSDKSSFGQHLARRGIEPCSGAHHRLSAQGQRILRACGEF